MEGQLKPRGCFGENSTAVYATGNGCYSMIGQYHTWSSLNARSDHLTFDLSALVG